ncbi:MAG: hypothetical protein J6A25_02780 [Lachnospiraceae bacterium]|nr:hypothetical protein [Lachnospiraceae bacterium]
MLYKNFTEEEMKTKAREMVEFIYRTTRETEASEFDKFMYQLLSEYLEMKQKSK